MNDADPSLGPAPFASLSSLRAQHLALLKAWRNPEDRDSTAVEAFRRQVIATGTVLTNESEREAAQDILEYWGAQLLSASSVGTLPELDLELAPFTAEASSSLSPPPEGAEPGVGESIDRDSKAHEQIRLNALARQWRQSHRVGSYLLDGAALARAASFRDADPEIAEFVAASERRVTLRKKRRIRRVVTALLVTLPLLAGAAYMYRITAMGEQAALIRSKYSGSQFSRASWNVVEFAKDYDPGQRILFEVALIDHPDDEQGRKLIDNLIAGLKPDALPRDEQVRATDALVGNLMRPSLNTLTPVGRQNLLAVLASISARQWSSPPADYRIGTGWIAARAGARRALAHLLTGPDAITLSEDEAGSYETLRRNIALQPPPAQDVTLRFEEAAKAGVADVGEGMKALGWRLQEPQPATSALSSSEVAYGASTDTAVADMLAADLSKCGFKIAAPRLDPAIKANTLEIRLAEALPATAGCVPKAS